MSAGPGNEAELQTLDGNVSCKALRREPPHHVDIRMRAHKLRRPGLQFFHQGD
jgi:hypothetical protein